MCPDIPTGSDNGLTTELWKTPCRRPRRSSSFEVILSEHLRPLRGLAHLFAESLVRHGFEPSFDHRRLQWSNWFRCQDSFSLVLAPCKPGLFALGEEVIAPRELAVGEGKRMPALFQISEADDCRYGARPPVFVRQPRPRALRQRTLLRPLRGNRRRKPTPHRPNTALRRWMASSAEAAQMTSA